MKEINMALVLFYFFIICTTATAQERYPFTSTADTNRFQSLTKEIRCVVCQNQNLAESNAPLANDLREKIYQMVRDNKSNEEIKHYLVNRYGEFILLRPSVNKFTFLLWTFPFIGLSIALLFLLTFLRPNYANIN